jgi:SOS-response transcriptional repressor LexA
MTKELSITAKQFKVLCYIIEHYDEHGVSPTFAETQEFFDLKHHSNASWYFYELEDKGFLMRRPKMRGSRKYKPSSIARKLYDDIREHSRE